MSYSHCGKCRGLVADTDHACRICNRPIERTGERAVAGAAVTTARVATHPMSQTAPGRPGRRRPPHQLETFLRANPGDAVRTVPAPTATATATATAEPATSPEPVANGPSEALRARFLSAPPPSAFAPVAPVLRPEPAAPEVIDLTEPAALSSSTTPGARSNPAPRPDATRPGPAAPSWAVPAVSAVRERAIVVEGLRKTYGEGDLAVEAVRTVDFEVHEGEVVLIMGPSGSGKTTLLLMLGAMLRPTSGSVVIGGTAVSSVPERQLPKVRAKHLGFIFQDFNLLSALTAQENVELACNLAGVRGRRAAARAAELLERVGLGHRLTFRPNQLSGGEKQRVAVARALANNPPLLLADEPTANLDSAHGKSIGQLLRRLADEDGRTSLIVTHDDRLTEIADRVLWLEDGTISPSSTHHTSSIPTRGRS